MQGKYRKLCRNYELTFDSAEEMLKLASIRMLLNNTFYPITIYYISQNLGSLNPSICNMILDRSNYFSLGADFYLVRQIVCQYIDWSGYQLSVSI